jgi:chromate transporter
LATPHQESESGGRSTAPEKAVPRARDLFVVWLTVAAQGVGGGGASQLSAYNSMVRSRKFFSATEWADCWAVCQVVPGVNIVAMALLTGSRLAGVLGAVVSLGGLVVPSAAFTLVIASVYTQIAGSSVLHAGLHGVIAAGAAASFMNSYRLSRPALTASYSEGAIILAVAIVSVLTAAVLIERTQVPVFVLLLAGGAVMAATVWLSSLRPRKQAT